MSGGTLLIMRMERAVLIVWVLAIITLSVLKGIRD
jgi:hypothetical protein